MKTVLGEIRADALGVTLPHEHICCYSEYALKMVATDTLIRTRFFAPLFPILRK